MKKLLILFVLLTGIVRVSVGQADFRLESPEQKQARMKQWVDDRFGLFVHWGIYAVPARHEWVQNYESIPGEVYRKYFEHFDPDLYDPVIWAKEAKAAGMKYMVITTKHHDGFCLWDTEYTDFKATNTPAARDLIRPMVEAFRNEGIKVGFYYSLIDWNHPDFPLDKLHPMRNNTSAKEEVRKIENYQHYVKNQLTELLTEYGQIDQLFLDFSYPGDNGKGRDDWDSENLISLIRKLQPNIILNDRMDLDDKSYGWDYKSPEQFMPREWVSHQGELVPWETCQTFSGSWGYHRDENTWKSTNQLLVMLIETVSKGGNLLLNVGPTARGNFDDRAVERLRGMGDWMKYNQWAIYACTAAPDRFEKPENCLLTYNPEKNRLYIHVLEWPFKSLYLKNYKGKIKYAQLLHDGSEVRHSQVASHGSHTTETGGESDLILHIPVVKPGTGVPVIEIFLND
ncbi:alpha-L-fucosidase [Belliella marina]|uniref:alpha-L-fucosidase n=1 Tax=Belliella marina TaxID=1644146 RepID=A0ABW4VS15_9BACT